MGLWWWGWGKAGASGCLTELGKKGTIGIIRKIGELGDICKNWTGYKLAIVELPYIMYVYMY